MLQERTMEVKVLIILLTMIKKSYQHARLMEPPSRSSMWRVGFPTEKNVNDNALYCGGFQRLHFQNDGRCGICGDPWDAEPKENEAPGGKYAAGIIVNTYREGSVIPVVIDISANHQGFFEFKLCPNNDVTKDPTQECFDHNGPLRTGKDQGVRFQVSDHETGPRTIPLHLPPGMECQQCILQWTWVSGNNWGTCANGTGKVGCGAQEVFRACSDIEITPKPHQPQPQQPQPIHHLPDPFNLQSPLLANQALLNPLMNPNQAMMNPNQALMNPNQAFMNPNQVLMNPNQVLMNPNQVLMNPNQALMNPNQALLNPNQAMMNSLLLNQGLMNPMTSPSMLNPLAAQAGLQFMNKGINNPFGQNLLAYGNQANMYPYGNQAKLNPYGSIYGQQYGTSPIRNPALPIPGIIQPQINPRSVLLNSARNALVKPTPATPSPSYATPHSDLFPKPPLYASPKPQRNQGLQSFYSHNDKTKTSLQSQPNNDIKNDEYYPTPPVQPGLPKPTQGPVSYMNFTWGLTTPKPNTSSEQLVNEDDYYNYYDSYDVDKPSEQEEQDDYYDEGEEEDEVEDEYDYRYYGGEEKEPEYDDYYFEKKPKRRPKKKNILDILEDDYDYDKKPKRRPKKKNILDLLEDDYDYDKKPKRRPKKKNILDLLEDDYDYYEKPRRGKNKQKDMSDLISLVQEMGGRDEFRKNSYRMRKERQKKEKIRGILQDFLYTTPRPRHRLTRNRDREYYNALRKLKQVNSDFLERNRNWKRMDMGNSNLYNSHDNAHNSHYNYESPSSYYRVTTNSPYRSTKSPYRSTKSSYTTFTKSPFIIGTGVSHKYKDTHKDYDFDKMLRSYRSSSKIPKIRPISDNLSSSLGSRDWTKTKQEDQPRASGNYYYSI